MKYGYARVSTLTQKKDGNSLEIQEKLLISTHTPVKGVTGRPSFDVDLVKNFNSHAREGRDTLSLEKQTILSSFQLTRP